MLPGQSSLCSMCFFISSCCYVYVQVCEVVNSTFLLCKRTVGSVWRKIYRRPVHRKRIREVREREVFTFKDIFLFKIRTVFSTQKRFLSEVFTCTSLQFLDTSVLQTSCLFSTAAERSLCYREEKTRSCGSLKLQLASTPAGEESRQCV